MTLVLQWRQPSPRFALRWHGRDGVTGTARAAPPPATVATIIGPPGPPGPGGVDPGDITLIFDNRLI